MNDLISRDSLMCNVHTGMNIIEMMQAIVDEPAARLWVPVTERLPEKSGDYLAFTEKGIFIVLSYSEMHRAFNAYDWCENITPIRCTHWMPLPEVEEHD